MNSTNTVYLRRNVPSRDNYLLSEIRQDAFSVPSHITCTFYLFLNIVYEFSWISCILIIFSSPFPMCTPHSPCQISWILPYMLMPIKASLCSPDLSWCEFIHWRLFSLPIVTPLKNEKKKKLSFSISDQLPLVPCQSCCLMLISLIPCWVLSD